MKILIIFLNSSFTNYVLKMESFSIQKKTYKTQRKKYICILKNAKMNNPELNLAWGFVVFLKILV